MDIGKETAENIVIDNNYTTTNNNNNTTPTKQSRSIQGIPSGKQKNIKQFVSTGAGQQ